MDNTTADQNLVEIDEIATPDGQADEAAGAGNCLGTLGSAGCPACLGTLGSFT